MAPPREVEMTLEVDGEGVVRATYYGDVKALALNERQLGLLLTALLKAVVAVHPEQDEYIEVSIN